MSENIKNVSDFSPFTYDVIDQREPLVFDGIPILVRDYKLVQSQIEEAKNIGRKDWYEESQDQVWSGPYRHHLLKRKKYVEGVLEKYSSKKFIHSLLDLGCGDGANLKWLRSYTKKLYGSDYNISRLIRAKQKNIATKIVLADINDYPAKDESFDLIFFNHVLEHILDDEKALSEVFRILKKGGLCILGVPNEGAFWWQLAYKIQPQFLQTTDHVHFYTVNSLSVKIKQKGFEIKEIKKLGWGVPHWDLDSRLRNYKIIDDFFETFGKIFLPEQASSLYFILEK